MFNIAIFASGSGSNAENMMVRFKDSPLARVALILSDRKDAYVLERARKFNVPTAVFTRKELNEEPENRITGLLKEYRIDLIVLAGFLLKIPEYLLERYPEKILNVHPALLPKYGGKGMYGEHVHQAVIAAHEKESGITIHLIDRHYDQGSTLYQSRCRIGAEDTAETLALKIHELEKEYPHVVESYIKTLL